MQVVSKNDLMTRPANPAYDAGWVFAFRKCPECKYALELSNETDVSFDFKCLGCSLEGSVDMSGINDG